MKTQKFSPLFILVVATMLLRFSVAPAQDADPLVVTLPTGKVVHFQTPEQKARYLAAQASLTKPVPAPSAQAGQSDWNKTMADRAAKADLDAQSRMWWIRVNEVRPEGILADYVPAQRLGGPGQYVATPDVSSMNISAIFVTCRPKPDWAEGTTFRANVYPAGTHALKVGGSLTRTLPNYLINGEIATK